MDYEQLGLTLPESTLLWEARPASVRPLLESALGLLTRATAGPNISGSFAKLGPDGSWLKIALGCSQLTMDGSLEIFSGVWPRRATMFAGIVGEPPTSERRTNGTGCLSSENWATPNTMDFLPQRSTEALIRQATTTRAGRTRPANLREQVDPETMRNWPTPTASEATHGGPNQRDSSGRPGLTATVKQSWPTPDTRGFTNEGALQMMARSMTDYQEFSGMAYRACEKDKAKVWNTPTCNDAKNSTLPPSMGKWDSLTGDLIRDGAKGQLNPDWVETLQGYPAGWTRLPEGWKNSRGQLDAGRSNTNGNRPE